MRILRAIRWLLVGLSVLLLLLYAALQLSPVQRMVLTRLPDLTGGLVAAESLSGTLPQHARLAKLTLRDAQGPWLIATDIALDWHPLAWLRGTLTIRRLSVGTVQMLRQPLPRPTTQSSEPFRLPHLPRLVVEEVSLPRIDIAPAVLGQHQVLALEGHLAPQGEALVSRWHMRSLEGPETTLNATLTLKDQSLQASLAAREAAGGFLGHLAGLAPNAPLTIDAEGAWNGRQASLRLRALEGTREILGATLTPRSAGYHLALSGDWPDQWRANPSLAPLISTEGPSLRLEADAIESANQWQWSLTQLTLGTARATGQGVLPLTADAPLSVQLELTAPLQPFLPARRLGGHAAATVALSGTVAAPRMVLRAMLPDGVMDGRTLPPLSLEVQLAQAEGAWELNPLTIHVGDAPLTGQARYAQNGQWQAQLALVSLPLAALRPLLPAQTLPASAQALLSARLDAHGQDAAGEATIVAAGRELSGLPANLAPVLGRQFDLQTALRFDDKHLTIISLDGTSQGGLLLHAGGDYALATEKLCATLDASLRDARVLAPGLPGGTPKLTLTAEGALDALAVSGDMAWAPPNLPPLSGHFTGKRLAQSIEITLLELRAAGARLEARGSVPNDGAPRGEAKLAVPDLASLGRYAGQDLRGRLDAQFASRGNGATVRVAAHALVASGMAIDQLQLSADIPDLRQPNYLSAELNAKDVRGQGWALNTLRATARPHQAQGMDWALAAGGIAQDQPLRMEAGGQWQHQDESQRITFARLKGQALGQAFALLSPTKLRLAPNDLSLAPTTLAYGRARLSADFAQSSNSVRALVTLARLRLQDVPGMSDLPPGSVAAQFALDSSPAAPHLSGQADVVLEADNKPALTLASTLDWRGGAQPTPLMLTLHATAPDGGKLDGQARLQGRFQLAPFAFDLPPTAPLAGQLALDLPLKSVDPWLRASGQRLGGRMAGSLSLAGTRVAPQISGDLAWSGGSYDQPESGLCLRHVEARLAARGQTLTLQSLTATSDGKPQGNLHVQGTLGLADRLPVQMDVAAKDYNLFCGGMASGQLNANLQARGDLGGQARLTGAITTGPMAVNLPENAGAANIPQLKIIDPNANAGKARTPSSLALDIAASVPGRLFVRGRGLEAEFLGDLRIKGTATTPEIIGDLKTKRGKFNLLDRQLTLSQGILHFAGSIPPSPSLDVAATSKVQDTTITVSLTGPAAAPKLALTSDPSLPQDEILARLLFRRELTQISPYQAIQLARAARQLAGEGGGGPDVLGSLRGMLGLDTLSIEQNDAGESTVGTGKYLADGVYVGVEQGRTPDSRRIKTELEVIPDITLQTTTGSKGETGGGVEWKYDY